MKTDVNGNIYMEQDEYQEYLTKQEEERATKAQQMNLAEEQAPLAETSLYELNQSLVAQLPVYDEKKWTAAKLIIADWFKKNLDTYYMMLCKEQSYYTVFDMTRASAGGADFAYEVQDTCRYIGQVRDISIDTNGMIAIWVDWNDNTGVHCCYLFPYGQGVIRV